MNFDDGIIKICDLINASENGKMPQKKLAITSKHYFGYETVYNSRYFNALQANVKIENLMHILQDREIQSIQIAVDEDGQQFRIAQVQHGKNKDGMDVTWLSLERLGEKYEFEN